MLWACLHFPHLPLETLARADAQALALAVTTPGTRPCIVGANARANALGIRPGMSVSAALALAPQLVLKPRDPNAETRALLEIAQWAVQFSPALSLPAADALLLEIGAGLKLFGGLSAALSTISSAVGALGFSARLAAAPTPTAALLFARADRSVAIAALEQIEPQLARLPVAALGCAQSVLETFADLGVQSIGALLALPRDGLARRFGQGLVDQLDRALGRRADPQAPFAVPERFDARLELPAPAEEAQALLFAARRLITTLCGSLAGRGLGAMRLRFELLHEDGDPTRLALDLAAPRRDPEHLSVLLRERLERIELPGRVEAIALAVEETAALGARSSSLFPSLEPAEDAALYERLAARLGEEAVCALLAHADHRPERAWRSVQRPTADRAGTPAAARPLWLLAEPQPLEAFLQGPPGQLTLLDGPERIESGWWEGRDVRRDYFVARRHNGQTLWVFKGPQRGTEWYVHGIFA